MVLHLLKIRDEEKSSAGKQTNDLIAPGSIRKPTAIYFTVSDKSNLLALPESESAVENVHAALGGLRVHSRGPTQRSIS